MAEVCAKTRLIIPFPDELQAEGLLFREEGTCALGFLAFQLDFDLQCGKYLMTSKEEDLLQAVSDELARTGVTVPRDHLELLRSRCFEIEEEFDRLVYFSLWCYSHNIYLTMEDLPDENQC